MSEPTPEESADPAKAADWLNDVFGMRDGTPRTVVVGPVIEDELQRVCAQLRRLAPLVEEVQEVSRKLSFCSDYTPQWCHRKLEQALQEFEK